MKNLFFVLSLITLTTQPTVIEIDGPNDLNAKLKQYPNAVIKFYRPNCPHCRTIAADYNNVSNAVQGVAFLAVNTENLNNRPLLSQWTVIGVPMLYFVKNGERKFAPRENNFRTSFEKAIRDHFKP